MFYGAAMEKISFVNSRSDEVYYLKWNVENARACVVISHGMVEHPARYDAFAQYMNRHGIAVYGIYHIGHGSHAEQIGHMAKGDFDVCISNLHELITLIKKETNLPVILFGHSMGSFMSQLYITRYNDIAALILSGSTKAAPIAVVGSVVAKVLCALSKNKAKPSIFMNLMAFGSYNKAFEGDTLFDWLSSDAAEVQKYIADELCGAICSISFFENLTGAMAEMGKKKHTKNIDTSLPIYIQGGSDDPVSEMGKGLYALRRQYEELGCKRVEFDIYEGARHEILNDTCRDKVCENTLKFIESVI